MWTKENEVWAPWQHMGQTRAWGVLVDGQRLMRLMSADDNLFITKNSTCVMWRGAARLIQEAKCSVDEDDAEQCSV